MLCVKVCVRVFLWWGYNNIPRSYSEIGWEESFIKSTYTFSSQGLLTEQIYIKAINPINTNQIIANQTKYYIIVQTKINLQW